MLIVLIASAQPSAHAVEADPAAEQEGGPEASSDADSEEQPSSDEEAEQESGFAYEVAFPELDDEALKSILQASSQLVALQSKPPATAGGLRRRIDEDLKRFSQALRSEGYYQSEISYTLDETQSPAKVSIEIIQGPRTTLAEYSIQYLGDAPPEVSHQPSLESLGVRIGMAARAPAIVAAQNSLITQLKDRGYPSAAVSDRKTLVDVATDKMTVTLDVEAGRFAHFGDLSIGGLETVDQEYVAKLVTWTKGDVFDQRLVESTRRALLETGLFSSIRIAADGPVDADGLLPMAITATEGAHRSIGFGVEYSTDTGFGGDIFWQHRNYFGENELLRTSLVLSQIEQSLQADFRKPHYLQLDQSLLANVALERENTDAFDRVGLASYFGLEREWDEYWTVSAGITPEFESVEDDQGRRDFIILGLPLHARRDGSDNFLNPTEGTRFGVTLTPYTAFGDEFIPFFKSQVEGSAYYAIDSAKRFVLAGRTRVGSIVGATTEELPADKRFYAGGGGSIRGYAYQLVGPLDSDDDPLGGRSLFEFSGEMRIKVTDTIGVVPFVDGGTVFDSPYPDFEEKVRWAAGLGLRYFTGVGPIRLDIAVPLNRRRGVDDAFQFYVSIGQAF